MNKTTAKLAGTVLLAGVFCLSATGQRQTLLMNHDWNFRFSHPVNNDRGMRVDLPHTWNAQDALNGQAIYRRGIGNYTKKMVVKPEWKEKRQGTVEGND